MKFFRDYSMSQRSGAEIEEQREDDYLGRPFLEVFCKVKNYLDWYWENTQYVSKVPELML